MLRVFPITLIGAAKTWVDRLSLGTVDSWDILKKEFIQKVTVRQYITVQVGDVIHNFKQEGDETLYQAWEWYNNLLYKCPTHDINSHQKVNIFYNGLSTMNRQLLDSQGPIPGMTPAQALTAIQTMADHSQKGSHLDKECPQNKEVKSVEEVKYGDFGRPSPFNLGLPTCNHNCRGKPIFVMTSLPKVMRNMELLTVSPPLITHNKWQVEVSNRGMKRILKGHSENRASWNGHRVQATSFGGECDSALGSSDLQTFPRDPINPCDGSSIVTLNKRFVGGTPCLSVVIADCEKSLRVLSFIKSSHPQLHLGIRFLILSRLTFYLLAYLINGLLGFSIPIIPVVPAEVPIVPADPLVAPEVGVVYVISPIGVLDLVDYSSSSDSDPSEDSLPVAPEFLWVSPFLCSDDSEGDTILVRPGEAIPFGRPYRTHPNRPRKLLTARKRVRPFPAHRLAWRRISHRSLDRHFSPDFTSDSSSSGSSSDSSLDISSGSSSDSLSDSSTVHSSGCDAPESSPDSPYERSLDSSSPFAGPSHKRCRSPTTLVPLSTFVSRLIALALADLLPCKRFRDSYSSEDGIAMGFEIATSDIREDEEEFEAEDSAGGKMEIAVDSSVTGGISEPTGGEAPDLEGTLYDIAHYMSEVPLDRITEFETAQRQLEAGQLVASGEREGYLRRHMALSQEAFLHIHRDPDDTRRRLGRKMTNTRSGMTPAAIEEMINRHVVEAIETHEANRNIRLRNGNDEGGNGNGNGNGNRGGNGNGNHNENARDARPVIRELFHISKCPEKYQVKYATCTLLNNALTWWNSHKRTIGTDTAFSMSWRELMKLMAEVHCPKTEIQKIESELWNLTVKNNNLAAYTQRFQELTMLCTKMVPEEEDRVEKFIGGLPDNIQGNVIATEPTRLQDVVRMANNLMDQKLKGYAMKNAENKRKFDKSQKDNRRQQQPFKRHNVRGQNVARAYTTGNNERRVYNGPLPLCNKCKFHYEGPCTVRYGSATRQEHYRSDYPKLKDQNCGNQTGNKSGIGEARGKAYVLGGGDANPTSSWVCFFSTTIMLLYVVELADKRVSETNTVLRGCTLGLLGHQFNINLMPVELGSFCLDNVNHRQWLVQGDRNGKGKKSKLSIISCAKTQKYIKNGCPIFLAQVMKKETKDKSEEKRLEDVPTVRDFSNFPLLCSINRE
ncbi:reverse transcriptase domain-containing protein [Tanacetum coccineum]